MNKQEYLLALQKELKAAHVSDLGDIVNEYEEHFALKQADGYSEEEIAAKLANPRDIAAQYAGIRDPREGQKGSRVILSIGLGFADIFVVMFFIVFFAWIAVMGALTISAGAAGVCLITGLNIAGLIPGMPYLGALLLGIACLALAALAAVGTAYCYLYTVQLLKAYLHWHRNTLAPGGRLSPPLPKHPQIPLKARRIMRTITLIALAVFGIGVMVGMITLFIHTRSLEPWHQLGWFR